MSTTAIETKSDSGMTYTALNRLIKTCGEAGVVEITLPDGTYIVFESKEVPVPTKVAGAWDIITPDIAPITYSTTPNIDPEPIVRNNGTGTIVENEEIKELFHDDLMDMALSDPEQYEAMVSEQMSRDAR